MLAPIALLIVTLSAAAYARRRLRRLPARAVIVSPSESTVVAGDGRVRSKQSADLTFAPAELDRIWGPANLENLARTYWLFLSRATLGLIRVVYSEDTRSVVFLRPPLTLLRFDAPEYTIEPGHGTVRWRIKDGLLVARSGRGSGYLALDVKREEDDSHGRVRLRITAEVSNFYPSLAVGFGVPFYRMTQAFVHVLVTNSFLRSLAKLRLAESKVGALADQDDGVSTPDRGPDATDQL
ncbi:MAG TPA: hypothetical protein VII87_00475 [Solirubrobacteraceae bacterium]